MARRSPAILQAREQREAEQLGDAILWDLHGTFEHAPDYVARDWPGLYVIGLHESAWSLFDLGDPPETETNMWVYVGKSERSLATRTIKTHLGVTWGCTGRSSFRRTL